MYVKTNWENLPSTNTPINATNLNKIENELSKTDTIVGGDAYDSTATYEIGDFCIYNNTLYRCTTAISTAEAWNSTHWTDTNIVDELNNLAIETGVLTSTSQNATLIDCNYYKYGRVVQIVGAIQITSGSSSAWTFYDLVVLPDKLRPLDTALVTCARDNDGKLIGVAVSADTNTLYVSSRGRGSLTTSNDAISFNLVYVSST